MALTVAAEQWTSLAAVRAAGQCGCITDTTPDDAALDLLIDQASDVLSLATSGKVTGRREVSVRPCRSCYCGSCECCELDGVPLWGPNPVIDEVKVDGDVLDPAGYGVMQRREGWYLVKVATSATRPTSWPASQDLWRPDTEDRTFSITYTYGVPIDWLGQQAAIETVCDFASIDKAKTNALPRGTVSANMGGVQLSLQDRILAFNNGRDANTLGPMTAQFLSAYAPDGRARAEVWAPELEAGWTFTVFS